MIFVKGTPIKGCKKSSWYLYIDGSLESRHHAFIIINKSLTRIKLDPHIDVQTPNDILNSIFIVSCARAQVNILMGEADGYYMNKVGGMCSSLAEITQEMESDQWPQLTDEDRIEIKRWPKGRHYYAKVDGEDVVDKKGNVKWNTIKAAKAAAEKFMKIKHI